MSIYKDNKKTKDGRQYYFRVMINGIRHQSKYYLTKEEARKEEAIYILQNRNPIKKPFTVVADSYFKNLETYCKYSTIYTYIKDYNKHIYPFFARYDINSINVPIYNKWWLEMAKKGFKETI